MAGCNPLDRQAHSSDGFGSPLGSSAHRRVKVVRTMGVLGVIAALGLTAQAALASSVNDTHFPGGASFAPSVTYNVSPVFYHVGATLSFSTRVTATTPITRLPLYTSMWHVNGCVAPAASPCNGEAIADGQPGMPGIAEKTLGAGHRNTIQQRVYPVAPGVPPAPAVACTNATATESCLLTLGRGTTATIGFTTRLTEAGYFQVDVAQTAFACGGNSAGPLTCNGQPPRPAVGWAAFIRVLAVTATPTAMATAVPTAMATAVPTAMATAVPTATATAMPTETAMPTPTASATPTCTCIPAATPTAVPVPTEIPAPTDTPVPTEMAAPTDTPAPMETPAPTEAPVPTEIPAPTGTPVSTETPVAVVGGVQGTTATPDTGTHVQIDAAALLFAGGIALLAMARRRERMLLTGTYLDQIVRHDDRRRN